MNNRIIAICGAVSAMWLQSSNWLYAVDNDFSRVDRERKTVSIEQLRSQFEVSGEVLVLSKDGKRLLYKGEEGRNWSFGGEGPIVSNWSFEQKGLPSVAIRHEWNFDPEGKLTVDIKQYDKLKRGSSGEPEFGKLVKEKKIEVENFESISWVVGETSDKRVVVKLQPQYTNRVEPQQVGKLPMNSRRITIYDNKGNLWASRINNVDGNNIYFGVSTHKGSVYLSYVPFKGSKEIGTAEKGRIRVRDNGIVLNLESQDPLLPMGVAAKVYGFIDLNKKTEALNSVRSHGSDEEKEFVSKF